MEALKARLNGPYRHGQRWRVQVTTGSRGRRTVSYRAFDSYGDAADFMDVNIERMTAESDCLLRRAALSKSSRDGWVYAVVVAPETNRRRVKVGFTTDLPRRFAQHRTTNPTALLLAAWEADRSAEAAAHGAIAGRIGTSEVFVVPNVHEAIEVLGSVLGPRLRPMADIARPVGSIPALVKTGFATAKQRAPRPNGRTAIADLVIQDVRARQELGEKRYGVDLQANNGRDALVDAYQEAIDLAMYLRQLLEERQKESP